MLASNPPTFVPLPFADGGTKNTIPEAASPTPGLASLTTGFPAVTMLPVAAGGIPPAGGDFNGVLNLITQSTRWAQAGGGFKYNAAFATDSNVGGYPSGAVIERSDGAGFWLNLADSNETDPDGSTPTNWVPLESYGITAVTGLTNANVTLTSTQYGLPIITFAGTLTGNVQIIFPAFKSQWLVVNNTTGRFTLTCKTSGGTGIAIPQSGLTLGIWGDGTNINATEQTSGRLLRTLTYTRIAGVQNVSINGGTPTTTGASTYTPIAGMVNAIVQTQGGGSGGAGAAAPAAGLVSLGAPGCSGSYGKSLFTAATIGASQAVTVGLGSAGNSGSAGGTSSYGSLLTAPGGTAAGSLSGQTPPSLNGNGSPATPSTGANLISIQGASPNLTIAQTTTVGSGGAGGASIFGPGGNGPALNVNGVSAVNIGSGGSGSLVNSGGGTSQSGNGAAGIVIIEEYA